MGFTTTQNERGREVYACEANMEGCLDHPCKAHKCPHGYCQRYYFCDNCWKLIKPIWRKKHDQCKTSLEAYNIQRAEEQALLIQGAFLRVAALGHDNPDRVKVIFRNQTGLKKAYFMDRSTYHAIELLRPVTPNHYVAFGSIQESQNLDIYSNQ